MAPPNSSAAFSSGKPSRWRSASRAAAPAPADRPCGRGARNKAACRSSCGRRNETPARRDRRSASGTSLPSASGCSPARASGMTSSWSGAGIGSSSVSYCGLSAVLPRVPNISDGARLARGTCVRRGRGLDERELVARPDSPRRCTLPITALRVTPPKRPAIWLALKPSAQSFLSSSTLSSVQPMVWPPRLDSESPRRLRDGALKTRNYWVRLTARAQRSTHDIL